MWVSASGYLKGDFFFLFFFSSFRNSHKAGRYPLFPTFCELPGNTQTPVLPIQSFQIWSLKCFSILKIVDVSLNIDLALPSWPRPYTLIIPQRGPGIAVETLRRHDFTLIELLPLLTQQIHSRLVSTNVDLQDMIKYSSRVRLVTHAATPFIQGVQKQYTKLYQNTSKMKYLTLASAGIWGVNEWMESISLTLCLRNKLINIFKERKRFLKKMNF